MNHCHSSHLRLVRLMVVFTLCTLGPLRAEEVGQRWGTEEREREYYPIVNIPIPSETVIEAGAFSVLPDGRMAVGTRHGEIYLIDGVDAAKPTPSFHLFASGLDEIFGLDWQDNAFRVTQSCELTRVSDSNNDGAADRFENISDGWGYANYHEYAFGSKLDPDGNQFVALGLSESYHSYALNRGFIMKVAPDGTTTAFASGLRSPGGIGWDEHGALFYVESQGPWNCSCSLKAVSKSSFHGHPASFRWYEFAPELGSVPETPKPGTRIATEKNRIPQLVPYAVVFPYLRMGRSITAFSVDQTRGKFGPFENQMFLGDYTQSILMRATTEQVNGVWQGACYPFREGLSTGILNVQFTPGGKLLCGGTNRGWPVRGIKPFALERVEWSGKMPFEINRVTIDPAGFKITFTKPVDKATGSLTDSYVISAFTHPYHGAYGGPEIEQHQPTVKAVSLADDGLSARLTLERLNEGFVYELDMARLRSRDNEELLHRNAFYTVNEIPLNAVDHPVPPSSSWLTYCGDRGPGAGKHIVLIAADQEYRSEQSMPMLAKILAKHHGFHCTVLFGVNDIGQVDPTMPVYPEKGAEEDFKEHNIPGLEHLDKADLVIFFTRLLTLPKEQQAQIVRYLDSGKPIIGLRTANHGFRRELPYKIAGQQVQFGNHILGGSFLSHHGNWNRDSTRGDLVAEMKDHPVLRGVGNIWGTSDVYRTYKPGGQLPEGCTALVLGQPLIGRQPGSRDNPEKEALPIAWIKNWQTSDGKITRVFHSTMGSGQDFESDGLRRLVVNASYWCLGLDNEISPTSSVEPVGEYKPLASGFDYEKLGVTPQMPQAYK